MKKTLAVLLLGTALSITSPQNFFYSSPEDKKDNLKELTSDFFKTLNLLREFDFVRTWRLYEGLKFTLSFQVNYGVEFNPVRMDPVSTKVNFLFQYNF